MRTATTGLFILACLYTLYLAADLLIPLCIAALLALTLLPVVQFLQRLHVPRLLGAGLVVMGTLALLGTGISLVWSPAVAWIADVPEKISDLGPRITELRASVEGLEDASREISEAAEAGDDDSNPVRVQVEDPGILEAAAAKSPTIVGQFVATMFLMYFLLAYADSLEGKASALARRRFSADQVRDIAHEVRSQVSRYLLVFTLINLSLAVVVATLLSVVGFPNPILWGAIAGALNYAPYVGATITAALIGIVGLLNLDSLGVALALPMVFIVLTAIEGQLITPTLLGRQLALSPYIVFLSIILWGWIWGIAGALMAVPLVVITKIIADSVPALEWLSIILRRRSGDAEQADSADAEPVGDDAALHGRMH